MEESSREDPLWSTVWPRLCILSRSLSSKVNRKNDKSPPAFPSAPAAVLHIEPWVGMGWFVRFSLFLPVLVVNTDFPPSPLRVECSVGAFSSDRPTWLYEKSQLSLSFTSIHSLCKPGLLGICLCLRGIFQTTVHGLIPWWLGKADVFQRHAILPQLCVQAESWGFGIETFLDKCLKICFYGFSNKRFLKEGVLPLAANGDQAVVFI